MWPVLLFLTLSVMVSQSWEILRNHVLNLISTRPHSYLSKALPCFTFFFFKHFHALNPLLCTHSAPPQSSMLSLQTQNKIETPQHGILYKTFHKPGPAAIPALAPASSSNKSYDPALSYPLNKPWYYHSCFPLPGNALLSVSAWWVPMHSSKHTSDITSNSEPFAYIRIILLKVLCLYLSIALIVLFYDWYILYLYLLTSSNILPSV